MHRISIHQMGGGGYAVATHDLYELIAEELERTIALGKAQEGPGIRALAENISLRHESTPEAIIRRIQDVSARRSKSVNHSLAEMLVDELTGRRIDEEGVPTLPRSIQSGLEMVEAWTDLEGLEAHRLAHSLYNFANGYVTTFEEAEERVSEWETEQAAKEQSQDADAELVAA